MEVKTIFTTDAPNPVGPYSQAKLVGNTLYCSGQIPLVPATGKLVEGGIKEQTHQVCKNISALLKAAGFEFQNVVKATCFLKDMGEFAAFNEIYAEYFNVAKPARSTVQVAKLPMDVSVEIEVLAIK